MCFIARKKEEGKIIHLDMMELKESVKYANEELSYDFKSSFGPITSLHICLKMALFRENICRVAYFS